MITTKKNGMTKIEVDVLDCDEFKYAYADQLLQELGMESSDGVEPLRGGDPWYIQGDLHGIHVSATFNSYENLTLSVFDKKVSYKDSMKDTLNKFIETYREGWNEHHHSTRKREGNV
jgi:hypothetical protein